ncbi:MAG: permease prefix domain 1-containing protein [Pygmaiobacter massiliensis]|nr:permease prefix domain 1-containing protein [Pygmaiobacter massiliensis]
MSAWDKTQLWLYAVTAQVRWRAARPAIRQELADHIEDQAAAFEAQGEGKEEALAHALSCMGDARQVGCQLDAAWQPGKTFAIPAACAGLFGIWLICSIGAGFSVPSLAARAAIGVAAWGICLFMARLPLARLAGWGTALFLTTAACLWFFNLIGSPVNGRIYLFWGGRVLTGLSYLVWPLVLLYALALAQLTRHKAKGLLAAVALWVFACLPLIGSGWNSSAILFTFCCLVLVLLAAVWGWPGVSFFKTLWGLLGFFALVLATAGLRLLRQPEGWAFWKERFFETGYVQLCVQRIFQESGWFSSASPQALYGLPNASTDYLLAAAVARWGQWVAVAAFVCILLWAGFIARAAACRQSIISRLLLAGAGLVFLGQSLLFFAENTGFLPYASTPPPFFGTQATLFGALVLGSVLAAVRQRPLLHEPNGVFSHSIFDCSKARRPFA